MKIQDITSFLENLAPVVLQEGYDNAGLLTGDAGWDCTGIITTLDATEDVIEEAILQRCNLVIAHHPIIFSGLKKITGRNYVEKTVIKALKNDIAIYALHTNLDNVMAGVNGRIADMLGLINRQILVPKKNLLRKLVTFVPVDQADTIRDALFRAGGGQIGNYSECSFNSSGEGTFKASLETQPYVGEIGARHTEREMKIETIFPQWKEVEIRRALLEAHPYEEVAYDIYPLDNLHQNIGSGMLGYLPEEMEESAFLTHIKNVFNLKVIRHTALTGRRVSKIAFCGGAGSFLTGAAVASGADFYITGDVKYHEFFDANGKLVIADIGHYESEQYTIDLLFDLLSEKFPNFAVQKTRIKTNPVNYFG